MNEYEGHIGRRPMFSEPDEMYMPTFDRSMNLVYWLRGHIGDEKFETVLDIIRKHGGILPKPHKEDDGRHMSIGLDVEKDLEKYQEIQKALAAIRARKKQND